MMPPTDFGRYLQSVMERDIDLLLMEEFHAEPDFVEMFCSLVGLDGPSEFDGAWHSLNEARGETDLLLRVRHRDQRVAVFIENKVSAPAQPDQDGRYHQRAALSQQAGRFDAYVTAICAPQAYLDGMADESKYQYRVPYELILKWFSNQSGRRAVWRSAIIAEAIEQGRRGYTMLVHSGRTAFHRDFWELLRINYPEFHMNRPTPKGGQSSWIRFKGHSFPKGVTLNFKADQCVMDLEFQGTAVGDLIDALPADLPQEMIAVQTGKSAVLRLALARCSVIVFGRRVGYGH